MRIRAREIHDESCIACADTHTHTHTHTPHNNRPCVRCTIPLTRVFADPISYFGLPLRERIEGYNFGGRISCRHLFFSLAHIFGWLPRRGRLELIKPSYSMTCFNNQTCPWCKHKQKQHRTRLQHFDPTIGTLAFPRLWLCLDWIGTFWWSDKLSVALHRQVRLRSQLFLLKNSDQVRSRILGRRDGRQCHVIFWQARKRDIYDKIYQN